MTWSATILVALAGLVGCQPAAEDETTSDGRGAATADERTDDERTDDERTDDERGPAASIQPALPGLFALMAGLERDMAALSHGLWTADLERVAESAEAVANHPRIPPREVEAVAAVLGPDMAAFKAMDTEVHDQGLRVAELARRGDFEGVLRAEARLREACVACHSQFRERLRSGLVPDSVRARVAELAEPVATELVRRLGERLTEAMATGGAAHAVDFCAGEAQDLTAAVAADQGDGWAVKRTTLRTRNPRNAPDPLEASALDWFHAAEASGGTPAAHGTPGAGGPATSPDHHVQATADGDYRYYRPLRMAAPCLQCHGDPASIQPDVREALAERYPNDRATGYGQGDLRGLIRVTVPARALR